MTTVCHIMIIFIQGLIKNLKRQREVSSRELENPVRTKTGKCCNAGGFYSFQGMLETSLKPGNPHGALAVKKHPSFGKSGAET